MEKFYVTTPIYYVNDKPHIGHAYTTIVGDIFARYYRQKLGHERVFFLTGTDEHGVKILQAARKKNVDPQQFVDEVSMVYQDTWSKLGISYDYFFRTTNHEHVRIVQELLQKIYEKGLIYKATYKGIYCVGCEKYLTDDEIIDGKCIHHPNVEIAEQEEENYFFKLKELAPRVLARLEKDEYKVLPTERRKEIISKIQHGITDISISRKGVEWGVPIPWDPTHTVYVWVDALFNYYSATKIVPNAERFWPADLHLMAKDILWFHALVWEALLVALEIELPKVIYAHGFFSIEGQKMSKSLGNVIDPVDLVDIYGTDALRYLLLTSFSFGNDGDFSASKLNEKYNADLANGIGNLVSRVATLCAKTGHDFSRTVNHLTFNPRSEIDDAMTSFRPDEALLFIRNDVQLLDKRIHDDAPWKLKGEELLNTLNEYILRILQIAHDLTAFLPGTSESIKQIFCAGIVQKPEPLFLRK